MSSVETKKKDSAARTAFILFMICAVAGLLLGIADKVTSKPIADKKASVNLNACREVFPDAGNWKSIEISNPEEYSDIAEVFQCSEGYAIRVVGKGYAGDDIEMVVGIDSEGTITGMRIVSHSETPGLGARATEPEFYEQFAGRSSEEQFEATSKGASSDNEIDAITGATKTSRGVVNAVNRACEYYQNELRED